MALILCLLVGGYLAGGYLVYDRLSAVEKSCDPHNANRPDHFVNISEWPEFDMSPYFMTDYDDVRFPSRETGYAIAGWYVAGDPDRPAITLLDGLGGCRRAQAVLVSAGMLWRNGYNVLIIDLHDTAESEIVDGYSTLGNDEYLDILGAWDWLVKEKGFAQEEIGILGNSLGAVTGLYAFADEPQAAAIFLNSPYANLPQVLRTELVRSGFPPMLVPAALIMGRVITGQNPLARTPLTVLPDIGVRAIFVVHSEDDKRVDIEHSHQFRDAALSAGIDLETWFIDGVDHVCAPAVYPAAFEERLVGFFERTLE